MNNFKPISEQNQKNIWGGSVALPMSPVYLAKTVCEAKAAELLITGQVKNMTTLGIAQEIFAHACCYYGSSVVKALGVDSATVDDIYSRSNPVDIEDGGDIPKRLAAYVLIWNLAPNIIP